MIVKLFRFTFVSIQITQVIWINTFTLNVDSIKSRKFETDAYLRIEHVEEVKIHVKRILIGA